MKISETIGGFYTELKRLNDNLERLTAFNEKKAQELEVLNRSNEKPPVRPGPSASLEETLRVCMKRGHDLLKRSDEAYRRKMERSEGGAA
jgi:hypothetical protein